MSGKTEEAASASASDKWDPEYRASVQEAVVTGTKFVVDKKYKIIKPIGHGAYGVVVYVRFPGPLPGAHAPARSFHRPGYTW